MRAQSLLKGSLCLFLILWGAPAQADSEDNVDESHVAVLTDKNFDEALAASKATLVREMILSLISKSVPNDPLFCCAGRILCPLVRALQGKHSLYYTELVKYRHQSFNSLFVPISHPRHCYSLLSACRLSEQTTPKSPPRLPPKTLLL